MLLNCPKCGFSQPKDKYCAKCGVDMETYRPRETPFWKKLLGHPLLHVSLIFAVVLASVLYIRERQQEELRARVEYLKGGPVLVDRDQKPQVEVSASTQAQSEIAREFSSTPGNATNAAPTAATENSATAVTTPTAPPPANAPAITLPPAPETATRAAAKTSSNRAVILYAEVNRAVLETWMEEMRAAGQLRNFDNVMMGVLPQANQKIKNARGVKILQQVEQPLQTAPSNTEWFVGTHKSRETENEMGFYSSLSLTDFREGFAKGELEVQRAFRDPKDPTKTMERVSFGSPFELTPGSAYVMRGLLPSKFATTLSDDNNPDPLLAILNSRSFENGQTEFTLILEFDTSAPAGK